MLMTDYLSFLVPVEDDPDGTSMGIFGNGERETRLVEIPVAKLRDSLRQSVTALKAVLEDASSTAGTMRLREAHIQFEVSATGGIHFVGTTELGAKGAITLVFGQ